MSRSSDMAFVLGAIALVAWVLTATLHDAVLILLRPIAPYFVFMLP